jgi:hypothetical protein
MIYHDKSSAAVEFEPLTLADGTAPRSSHVQLTGLAIPALAVNYASYYRFTYYIDDSSARAPGPLFAFCVPNTKNPEYAFYDSFPRPRALYIFRRHHVQESARTRRLVYRVCSSARDGGHIG